MEARSVVNVDVIDDGERLASFAEESIDFVIANHVLEHIEDPVSALGHWLRVLRPGGVLFVTLPDPQHTPFDAPRERTSAEHALRDYREGPQTSRRDHFTEWARLAERVPDEQIAERVAELEEASWAIHFHVWELEDFLSLLLTLNLPTRIEAAQAVKPEFSVILRKIEREDLQRKSGLAAQPPIARTSPGGR